MRNTRYSSVMQVDFHDIWLKGKEGHKAYDYQLNKSLYKSEVGAVTTQRCAYVSGLRCVEM